MILILGEKSKLFGQSSMRLQTSLYSSLLSDMEEKLVTHLWDELRNPLRGFLIEDLLERIEDVINERV